MQSEVRVTDRSAHKEPAARLTSGEGLARAVSHPRNRPAIVLKFREIIISIMFLQTDFIVIIIIIMISNSAVIGA